MGTTLVVVLRDGNTYRIANVGDSRAYRIDARGVEQTTVDHSFVAQAVRDGWMSLDEAVRSPWRNALTRAIGTDEEVVSDIFGPFSTAEPHVVVLCSDGLHKILSPQILRDYVLGTDDLDGAVQALVALAYRRGSDDNITAAAVEFGSLARRSTDVTIPVPLLPCGNGNGNSVRSRCGPPPETQPRAAR